MKKIYYNKWTYHCKNVKKHNWHLRFRLVKNIFLGLLVASYFSYIGVGYSDLLENIDSGVESFILPALASKNEVIPPLSNEELIRKIATKEGFDGGILVNLAKCESSLRENAVNINRNGTADLGIFQINTVHQDISNADKFNIEKATQWTIKKIRKGAGHIWVCWKSI